MRLKNENEYMKGTSLKCFHIAMEIERVKICVPTLKNHVGKFRSPKVPPAVGSSSYEAESEEKPLGLGIERSIVL